MIRIGCWGILYYNHIKEPPRIVLIIILAPILLKVWVWCVQGCLDCRV